MLSEEQIKKIISENEYLKVQLNELNEILALREEEIEILNQNAFDITELRSQMEGQLSETQSLQSTIEIKQQQAKGAANREKELEEELVDAAKLLRQYSELKQQHTYTMIQLQDLETRVIELTKQNADLEKRLQFKP